MTGFDMGYSVYLHTNKTNGKKYVGITSQKNVERRWSNGAGYKKQRRFYCAIKSYGWDGFTHEILYSGLTKEQAEAKEEELILLFRSNDLAFGYNIENGGRTRKISEEQKNHLREVNTGKHHTEETKAKMSASHKGLSSCWLTGRKASEETKKKMSEKRLGANNPRAKSVVKLTLDGKQIAVYDTLNDAALSINQTRSAHISQCCRGERKSAYGFRWAYLEVI